MPFHFYSRRQQIITAAWTVAFMLVVVLAGAERAAPDFQELYVAAIGAEPPAPSALLIAKGGADGVTRPEALGQAKRPAQAVLTGGGPCADALFQDMGILFPGIHRLTAHCAPARRHPGDGFLISRLPTGPPA